MPIDKIHLFACIKYCNSIQFVSKQMDHINVESDVITGNLNFNEPCLIWMSQDRHNTIESISKNFAINVD